MRGRKLISILALLFIALFSLALSPHFPAQADAKPVTYLLEKGKRLGVTLSGDSAALHNVLIGFKSFPGRQEEGLVRGEGGTIKYTYHLVPAIAATIPEAAIMGLLENPLVRSIELDGVVYAIDAELDNTWGVKRIGANTVHEGGNKGTGVMVAIIDSGIDCNHLDLHANCAGGYDFVNDDYDPMDDHGHGTHVAGTVAAEDNGSGVVGVAPEAELYALKVLDSGGSGNYSDVIEALQWAVDNGIQVTNNSYGSSGDPGETVKAAFDNAYAEGVLNVCAAGNSGTPRGKGDNVIYPARYESCIAVAATDETDNRARWSSTGPDVELAAPGVNINSTLLGGGYGTKNGTSMASPHVAGTAALVIATGITDTNADYNINDEVRSVLDSTADDLGDAGRDTKYGYGLVDADEAAPATTENRAPVADAGPDQSVETGSTVYLDGTGSYDPDGDFITYSWAFETIPDTSSALLYNADTDTPTFVADVDGSYKVKLTVSDWDGLSDTDSVVVTAATGTEQPTVSVYRIDYATEGGKNQDKHLLITVALGDDSGNLVSGATVSIELDNTTTQQSWTGTGTTATDGTVTFSLKNAPAGYYTTEVTDVIAEGLMWDGITPENGFEKK